MKYTKEGEKFFDRKEIDINKHIEEIRQDIINLTEYIAKRETELDELVALRGETMTLE